MNTFATTAFQVVQGYGWGGLKWYLSNASGISEDALHIHAGLMLLLIAAALWRRPPWHWRPWLVVLVVEAINEAADLFGSSAREATLAASAHDAWMTLAWPTVILLVFPPLVRRYPPAPAEDAE